ncbi:MAG TPA: arylsulfatase [Acetobacteraceae bacterium]|nr:arylsulfatase [Acetobacteraceae bacterium]
MTARSRRSKTPYALVAGLSLAAIPLCGPPAHAQAPAKRPNIVMLMTDDTGWNDFGAYSNGGKALGHPTPNVDQLADEGAVFTNWYGQASCTAGRASFITGRIPIRSALSIVVAPADPNFLRHETPTIAEFFKKNGYSTYFSGKWHLGDKPESYPIEHGFDEMKNFAAYYAGVYTYDYTNKWFHPWFPSYNPAFQKYYSENVNLAEWEGVTGQPAKNLGPITYDRFATFDEDQAANAVNYIRQHANAAQPFFMDVNFLKMHNPTNAAPDFAGKSHLGDYSDSLMELDADIGKIMDEIRKDAPNTIVIVTADNGAWLDAYPDAGTTPFRGEKGSPFEGGWRVPGIMWWPGHIPARAKYDEMMSHIDAWATLAAMAGLTPPPHEWVGNDNQPIYFDSIDNSAYILGKAQHSARTSWIYIDGETFWGARADIGGDPSEPWLHIAWKYLYTARDSWLGVKSELGAIGATYNLTMDPYEKYDMTFNGAAPSTVQQASPGKYAGQDNGWVLALISPVMIEFDKTVIKFPNVQRFVGGASTDLIPNLQNPADPVPLLRQQIERGTLKPVEGGGG